MRSSPGVVVSVVAPMFNEAATLAEFVGRLVQTARGLEPRYQFEFVLVDDGSTDGTLTLARSLIATEPRLRVVELRRNFGQTAALQAGLTAAQGDIVVSIGLRSAAPSRRPADAARPPRRGAHIWSAAGGTIDRRACSGAGRRVRPTP